jgi:hypothetical protein
MAGKSLQYLARLFATAASELNDQAMRPEAISNVS